MPPSSRRLIRNEIIAVFELALNACRAGSRGHSHENQIETQVQVVKAVAVVDTRSVMLSDTTVPRHGYQLYQCSRLVSQQTL